MDKKGKVYLIGAGPSDPGLFTLKGRDLLACADVIVYDRLVGIGILTMFSPAAKLIDVGKVAGTHPVPQDEINRILLREAQEGKMVVRLKGGDPFLFGRGGEELELLCEHNIPYEIVPGVTSAISVPAYAGIPVTHRDYTSSLHIITGHTKSVNKPQIDYSSLIKLNGTLVFLMGVSAMPDICKGLVDAGADSNLPAAVLERGTTARQRKVVATISTLVEEATKAQIKTPAIIVVGKVCSLSDEFEWYYKRPLAGKRVVITRPRHLSSKFGAKLNEFGGEGIDFPCIITGPLEDTSKLETALNDIQKYTWLVFTSPTGVSIFFDELIRLKYDVRKLVNLRIAAIGSSTAREINKRGMMVDFVPSIFSGEILGKELVQKLSADDYLLLARAKEGSEDITNELTNTGISYDDVPAYQTTFNTDHISHVVDIIKNNEMDYVAFTSASTVNGFVKSLPDMDFSNINALCIGDKTASEAKKYNMKITVSDKATIDSMIQKLLEV